MRAVTLLAPVALILLLGKIFPGDMAKVALGLVVVIVCLLILVALAVPANVLEAIEKRITQEQGD